MTLWFHTLLWSEHLHLLPTPNPSVGILTPSVTELEDGVLEGN